MPDYIFLRMQLMHDAVALATTHMLTVYTKVLPTTKL